jgi:hypothetical protein
VVQHENLRHRPVLSLCRRCVAVHPAKEPAARVVVDFADSVNPADIAD